MVVAMKLVVVFEMVLKSRVVGRSERLAIVVLRVHAVDVFVRYSASVVFSTVDEWLAVKWLLVDWLSIKWLLFKWLIKWLFDCVVNCVKKKKGRGSLAAAADSTSVVACCTGNEGDV